MKEIMNCDFCSKQQVIDVWNDDNPWWEVKNEIEGIIAFDFCTDCFKSKIEPLLNQEEKKASSSHATQDN